MKSFTTYKIVFFASLLFLCSGLRAQAPIAIAANDYVTTTVFFPSNIKKVVAPAANFQFTYDAGTNIGLLKGRKGKPSNLLVITEQGYIYSFALSFAEEVTEFNFILTTKQAISRNKSNSVKVSQQSNTTVASPPTENKDISENTATTSNTEKDSTILNQYDQQVLDTKPIEGLVKKVDSVPLKPIENDSMANGQDDLYDADREEYYKIFCENNYLQKTIFKRSFRQNKRIALRLNNILLDRNEKYFVLQIENNSKREYKVAGLSFFRKSNIGQLEKIMNPLYSFNLQETIDPESINEVVYVFKKFEIGNKERIFVALADSNSDNMVILPLDNLIINSPTN